jgi:hypothetical protein
MNYIFASSGVFKWSDFSSHVVSRCEESVFLVLVHRVIPFLEPCIMSSIRTPSLLLKVAKEWEEV